MDLDEFFEDLDRRWVHDGTQKVTLRLIGSAALFLQTTYARGTKDSDVLESASIDAATREQLERLAGVGSDLHKRHEIYIDVVQSNVPTLPHEPLWHPYPLDLRHLAIHLLDVADVVVSKLKRWNATDQERSRRPTRTDGQAIQRHRTRLVRRRRNALRLPRRDLPVGAP